MLLVCEKIFVALTTVFINDQCLCTEAGLSQDATVNVGWLERLLFLKSLWYVFFDQVMRPGPLMGILKKKGCLCGLTEAQALCLRHPLWRKVSAWMIRHGHSIEHGFLMIPPKPAPGKEADKQPLSRASRKETPRWDLFPSDFLFLGV